MFRKFKKNIPRPFLKIIKYLAIRNSNYINRSGWVRAAVLGANDDVLSTTSLAIGIATASTTRKPIILATIVSLVAGALSMVAGEYVSVSSQSYIETADLT